MQIKIPHDWKARDYQKPVLQYLKAGGKRAVTRWHRRAGKDDVYINWTVWAGLQRKGNYWYMLPEYSQARKSMWDAINPHTGAKRLDHAIPEGIRSGTNQQEMKITLKNGSTFQLVGSDNYNSLVGSPPVGLVFSEYAISNPSSWAYLMPILEENGGWACFNSTPRGKNHFHKLCLMAETTEGWYSDHRTAEDTGVFTLATLARIREELHNTYGEAFGEAMFQQEYYVSFEAAVIGAIWADCIEKLRYQGRICEVLHDERYPVHVSYDIGKKDSTALWFFQIIGQDIHIINHHESNHKDVPFYCTLLRDFSRDLGYRYGSQYLPHDAWHDTLAAGGKTVIRQFQDDNKDGKLGKLKRVPSVSRQDGIQAARATFPRCKFDLVRCDDGLEALKFYHHEYDDEKKVFSDNPCHDWASNSADSFRYLSLVWKEARDDTDNRPIDQQLIEYSVQNFTMKAITKQHLTKMREQRERNL